MSGRMLPAAAALVAVAGLLGAGASHAQEEAAAAEQAPDPMVDLFVSRCASCHSIGQGDRVGPDLSGAHQRRSREWLLSMITVPSRMLASDPDARALLARFNNVMMPDLATTEEQALGLIELITRCSDVPCDLAGRFTAVLQATAADIARGEALFLGHERLSGGAVPCMSCHTVMGAASHVPGGTLAVDLTNVFARLGDEGLDAALRNPPFIVMNRVFGDRPLTEDEAFALRAYLHQANLAVPANNASLSLPLFGLLLAGIVLLALNAGWSRRLRGVRVPLTDRARQDLTSRSNFATPGEARHGRDER